MTVVLVAAVAMEVQVEVVAPASSTQSSHIPLLVATLTNGIIDNGG